VEVQVAMLSERISQLTGHMQKNKHDYSSRQGLMKMLGRRKSLLSYLKAQDRERYQTLISRGCRGG
jgi:small subunit ribosomal protein S15